MTRHAAVACALVFAPAAALAQAARYDFEVRLDGQPVGTHRFVVEGDAPARTVESTASFDVRFLGFTAYSYRHHASERWQGDCLRSLAATTDDDGRQTAVRAERTGDATRVTAGSATRHHPACVMSFAYWNPALRRQTRLLNPQTGRLEAVHVEQLADGTLPVGGRPVAATHYRIEGAEAPVEVWYAADGAWIGLDSVVGGRHRLSYRLP